jgi:hypothetical protein
VVIRIDDDGVLSEPPEFDSIDIEPRVCARGDVAVLSWSATGAVEVQVHGQGAFPATGSTVVEPSSNGAFRLTAHGPGGRTTGSSPLLWVVEPPRIELLAAPAPPRSTVDNRVVSYGPPAVAASQLLGGRVVTAAGATAWRRGPYHSSRGSGPRPGAGYGWVRTAAILARAATPSFSRPADLLTRGRWSRPRLPGRIRRVLMRRSSR